MKKNCIIVETRSNFVMPSNFIPPVVKPFTNKPNLNSEYVNRVRQYARENNMSFYDAIKIVK